jgi:murein DD-endopeptidase MepM/ murein hydrolase activator NlpD
MTTNNKFARPLTSLQLDYAGHTDTQLPLSKRPYFILLVSTFVFLSVISWVKQPAVDTTDSYFDTQATTEAKRASGQITIPINLPSPEYTKEVTDSESSIEPLSVTVGRGDTLSTLFTRLGLSKDVMRSMLATRDGATLRHLRAGQRFTFNLDTKNENMVNSAEYVLNDTNLVRFTKSGEKWTSQMIKRAAETRVAYATATISNTLARSGQKAGISKELIASLAGIFQWDMDFNQLRRGDKFSILYEEQFIDGKKTANGNIVAAQVIRGDHRYTAIRHKHADGSIGYYNEQGRSLQRAFERMPIKHARISSHFNPSRVHPKLHRIRAHKGVDLAAATGTPIKAVGDGKVVFAGRKGGYGNVVILQHGNRYTSLYAHMSRFNAKKVGQHIRQGDVIGYVGSTGLATGPHLHYEFQVDGVHRDPMTVNLPSAPAIPYKERHGFLAQAGNLLEQLKQQERLYLALQ